MAVEQEAGRRLEVVPREAAWVALAVAGVVLFVVAFRIWLATRIVTPWVQTDELMYGEIARSFGETGTFHVRGDEVAWYNFGYAALIAPAWLVTEAQSTAFTLAKTINVGLGVAALVPTYLWARRLTSTGYALLAAGLTVLMPSLLYASTLMSENGFLPAFVFAAFAIGLALERPSVWRQGFALAAIVLASLVRVQGLVLLAVLPTAIVLAALFEARLIGRAAGRYLLGFWPTAATLGVLGAAYGGYKAAQGEALSSGLGSYRTISEANYTLVDSARWIARHLADLVLATGFFPVAALLFLVGLAIVRGLPTRSERAFLATAVAAIGWVVPQAALFASNFSFRIEERYIFCLFPLLFVALALWLYRGAPRRPWPLSALAAAAAAAVVVFALPLRQLLGIQILSDTFALIPLLRLSQLVSGGVDTVEVLVTLAVVAAALAFLVVPGRFAGAVALAIAVFFVLSSYSVHRAMRDYALGLAAGTYGADRSWVDRAMGPRQRVDYLYGGSDNTFHEASVYWQLLQWNRSLDDIYNTGVEPQAGIVEVKASIDRATGRLQLLPQDVPPGSYAVAAERLGVAGRVLARHGELALYRLIKPVRVTQAREGVYSDAWTGSEAAITQYETPGNRPTRLRVTASRQAWGGPDVPGRVKVRLGTVVLRDGRPAIEKQVASGTWVAHSRKAHTFTFRTPPPPFRIELEVSPTFSPRQFGLGDDRQLGVQLAVELGR